MAKFTYNNTKNTVTSYISFKFNYKYYFNILFEDKTDACLRFHFINKLAKIKVEKANKNLLAKRILYITAIKKSP